MAYAYDKESEVTSVTATIGGSNYTVATPSYLQYGYGLLPAQSMTMGDGSSIQWIRDQDLRLTEIYAGSLQSLSYSYDTDNRVTAIDNSIHTSLSETIGYDVLSRLNSITSTGLGNESITYDANGNRKSSELIGTYTVNPANNQETVTGVYSNAYDQMGNLTTTSTGGSVIATYSYDSFNHLVTVNGTANYSYNGLGQRVSKSGAPGTYDYIYTPSGTLLAETAQNSTVIGTDYIWLNNQPIGLIRNGTLYYVHDDHLGRPDTVTNAAGGIVWQASNGAFGSTVTTNTFGGLNIGFPGQYTDSESGLYYNGARYYHPYLGQYMESDPIGLAGGMNTYAYVGGNPVSLIDPYGLYCLTGAQIAAIAGGVGGAISGGVAGLSGGLPGIFVGTLAGGAVGASVGYFSAGSGVDSAALGAIAGGASNGFNVVAGGVGGAVGGAVGYGRGSGGAIVGGVYGGATAGVATSLAATVATSASATAIGNAALISGATGAITGGLSAAAAVATAAALSAGNNCGCGH